MATREELKQVFANGQMATGEKFANLIDSMKVVQLPVVDPQALGTSLTFIDSITQDADGKITATKKNVVLNYVNIQDKPQINGHTLNGDMSLKELGIINQIHLNDGTAISPDQSGNVKLPVIPQTTNTITPGSTNVPTADAVGEALEEQNLLVPKATPYTAPQKYNASANINDRAAVVAPVTNEVRALGYKVLNPQQDFATQLTDANTIYEIRYYFDISGNKQEPATVIIPDNCKLRFEGGMLGGEYVTLQGNNTLIESDSDCIQKGVKIAGTWGNDTIYTKWFEFISADDEWIIDGDNISRNSNCTDNRLCFKQVQAMINDGVTVVFNKNQYLQSSIEAKVTSTDSLTTEKNTVLQIENKKDVKIDLNGSTIKLLYTNSIMYSVIKIIKSSVSISNGDIVGCAEHYNYPNHNQTKDEFGGEIPEAIGANDYEWHWGIHTMGGYLSLHHVNLSWYCGTALMLGGYYVVGGQQSNYVPVSYDVDDVSIHHCGRGAVGCLSCEYGNFSNIRIDMCGMPADVSGVMPRDPRGAFGVEFEDLYYGASYWNNPYPRFLFDNITVTNVVKCIGVAYSNAPNDTNGVLGVKSFIVKNSNIQGQVIEVNNLKVGSFENCTFDLEDINARNTVQFLNCIFSVNAEVTYPFRKFGGIVNNCKFTDYSNSGYNALFQISDQYNYKPRFDGCDFQVHKMNLVLATFANCNIAILGNTPCLAGNTYMENTSVDGLNIYGYSATASNNIVKFEGCTLKNSSLGRQDLQGTSCDFTNCLIVDSVYYIKTGYKVNYVGCEFNNLSITAIGTSRIVNCNGTMKMYQAGATEIDTSTIKFTDFSASIPAWNIQNITATNSRISFEGTMVAVSTYTAKITARNSIISVNKGYNNSQVTLESSYVISTLSNWSESNFSGTSKNSNFSVPMPKEGISSNRPSSNLKVGLMYFDTTLGKPIYWNGTAWVDGNGETVGLQVNDTSVLIAAAQNSSKTINVYSASAIIAVSQVIDETSVQYITGNTADTVESTSYYAGSVISLNEGDIIRIDGTAVILNSSKDAIVAFTSGKSYIASGTETIYLATTTADTTVVYIKDNWLEASVGTASGSTYPVTLKALSANSTAPRGAKVIITNTDGEVVIINVVQSY